MPLIPKSEYVSYLDYHLLSSEDLSPAQLEFLRNLNNKLIELEHYMKKESLAHIIEGDKRVSDPNDWVEDYEIDCSICFYLNEDDPAYDEDRDNILVQLSECSKYGNDESLIADGINYSDYQNHKYPMSDEFHCWIYYCLYSHTKLGWVNILRVGMIWFDFEITYQKFIYL